MSYVFVMLVYQLVSCCRANAADEMLNAHPPQQGTYHGMIIEDRPSHTVSSGDLSMQQDLSRVAELQRDGYGDGSGERWMMSGHSHLDGNPDPSFRPHYSGFDERAVCDGMTWRSQDEVRALVFYIALHRSIHACCCQALLCVRFHWLIGIWTKTQGG